jgi:D-glycero-alpha-D-manno-heptose-7-phosphate kinase
MTVCIQNLLKYNPVIATAPCRIDSGGTWDIKSMALPVESITPVTINLALNLRTRITLSPYKPGLVKIKAQGFPPSKAYASDHLPFSQPFGIYFAAISLFNYNGLQVSIHSNSPIKSGLGGSSTALVALLKALSEIKRLRGEKALSARDILYLAYQLEDGINLGSCGMQDQAAAVYGGANLWEWRYSGRGIAYKRRPLLEGQGRKELSQRILVAYSGKSHVSLRANRSYIEDFLSGKTRRGWIRANDIVKKLGLALAGKDWEKAVYYLQEEVRIRRLITPGAFTAITARMIHQAEEMGCGARFAGAGAGGSVWALGKRDCIDALKKMWEKTLAKTREGRIIDCSIEGLGVRVS